MTIRGSVGAAGRDASRKVSVDRVEQRTARAGVGEALRVYPARLRREGIADDRLRRATRFHIHVDARELEGIGHGQAGDEDGETVRSFGKRTRLPSVPETVLRERGSTRGRMGTVLPGDGIVEQVPRVKIVQGIGGGI